MRQSSLRPSWTIDRLLHTGVWNRPGPPRRDRRAGKGLDTEVGRRLSTSQITSALRRAGRKRNVDAAAAAIRDALRAPQLAAPPLITDAYGDTAKGPDHRNRRAVGADELAAVLVDRSSSMAASGTAPPNGLSAVGFGDFHQQQRLCVDLTPERLRLHVVPCEAALIRVASPSARPAIPAGRACTWARPSSRNREEHTNGATPGDSDAG